MLKGIPPILPPELLKIMCEMGHGDRIVIADGNFPAEAMGKQVVRMDGHDAIPIIEAIMKLFPLDKSTETPVALMEVSAGEEVSTPIWNEYEGLFEKYDGRGKDCIEMLGRYEFYDVAKTAYAIIATGEKALYANLIIRKGII